MIVTGPSLQTYPKTIEECLASCVNYNTISLEVLRAGNAVRCIYSNDAYSPPSRCGDGQNVFTMSVLFFSRNLRTLLSKAVMPFHARDYRSREPK